MYVELTQHVLVMSVGMAVNTLKHINPTQYVLLCYDGLKQLIQLVLDIRTQPNRTKTMSLMMPYIF